MSTQPSVFIVESVRFSDEESGHREGRILSDILRMSGKDVKYRYIRTKKELRVVLKQFEKSQMRYLHISCHGSKSSLATTLDNIPFDEFAQMVNPCLHKKRLFISACEATNKSLAREIFADSGCISLCGPMGDILFGDAALMWALFYHMMFKLNPSSMKGSDIGEVLERVSAVFGVAVKYFRSSEDDPYFVEKTIKPTRNPNAS